MRIFVGIVGLLFLFVAAAAGLFGAVAIGDGGSDGYISCTSYAGSSAGTSTTTCNDDSPSELREQIAGVALVVGGAAFFVGGCALIAGAVAGSGRASRQQRAYPPQPVGAGGPPSYGGYQGQPSGGGASAS